MNLYTIEFAPEADDQLAALYSYIAADNSPAAAQRYTDAIVGCCMDLRIFPLRGTPRSDIRPGLRLTNHKGRCVIAYSVDEHRTTVSIIGVFYGGQDHEGVLRSPE